MFFMDTGRKIFTAAISEDWAKQFASYCESRGFIEYRAVEGALRCFMTLPVDLQVRLMDVTKDVREIILKEKGKKAEG